MAPYRSGHKWQTKESCAYIVLVSLYHCTNQNGFTHCPCTLGFWVSHYQADDSFMYLLWCCTPINATGHRLWKANIGSGAVFTVKTDNEFIWHTVAPNEVKALQYRLHNPERTCSYIRQLDFNIMVCYYKGFDRMWSVSHRRTEKLHPELNSQNLTSQWSAGLVYGSQGWSPLWDPICMQSPKLVTTASGAPFTNMVHLWSQHE